MSPQILITSFLLGLSASPACLGVCVPVLLPHIGVVGGKRPLQSGFNVSIFFALGRLVMYLGLGVALVGLGISLQEAGLGNWISNNAGWLVVTRFLLATLMVFYGLSVVFGWPKTAWCENFFQGQRQRPLLSMVLGSLVGSISCPALWIAFLYASRFGWLPDTFLSILSFWAGSSLLVIAIGVSAGALLTRWKDLVQIRGIAGATLIFVGALYAIGG